MWKTKKIKDEEPLHDFVFPALDRVIKARNYEEALSKLNS